MSGGLTADWALLKVAEWREASAAVTLAILQGEGPDTQAAQDRFQMAWAGVCGLGGEELRVLAAEVVQGAAQLEALTLERDRLAHELRLLREAVAENRAAVEWERLQVWLGSQDVPSQIHMRGNELVATIRDVMAYSPAQRELREAQAAVERAQKRVEAERRMVQVAADTQWAELDLAAAETALAHAQSSLAMLQVLQAAPFSSDTPERSGSDTFAGGEG